MVIWNLLKLPLWYGISKLSPVIPDDEISTRRYVITNNTSKDYYYFDYYKLYIMIWHWFWEYFNGFSPYDIIRSPFRSTGPYFCFVKEFVESQPLFFFSFPLLFYLNFSWLFGLRQLDQSQGYSLLDFKSAC